MARSFGAESLGANGFAVRGPVSAAAATGCALVETGGNQLGWTASPVALSSSLSNYLPTSGGTITDSIVIDQTNNPGYTAIPLEIHAKYAIGIDLYTHDNAGFRAPYINSYKSRGTKASPSPLTLTGYELDSLGGINFGGWDGSQYYAGAASIFTQVSKNWSSTSHGAFISIYGTRTAAGASPQQIIQFGGCDPTDLNAGGTTNDYNIISYRPISFGGNKQANPMLTYALGTLGVPAKFLMKAADDSGYVDINAASGGFSGDITQNNAGSDNTNYERWFQRWNSNRFELGTEKGGTGSNRTVRFISANDSFEFYDGNGNFRCMIGGGTLAMGSANGAARVGDQGQIPYSFMGAGDTGIGIGSTTAGSRSLVFTTDGVAALTLGGSGTSRAATFSGNVLIGTAADNGAQLQVRSSSNSTWAVDTYNSNSAGNSYGMQVRTNSATGTAFQVYRQDSATVLMAVQNGGAAAFAGTVSSVGSSAGPNTTTAFIGQGTQFATSKVDSDYAFTAFGTRSRLRTELISGDSSDFSIFTYNGSVLTESLRIKGTTQSATFAGDISANNHYAVAGNPLNIGTSDGQVLNFRTNNTTRMFIDASGHLRTFSNNSYDIGTSTSSPRVVYANAVTVVGTITQGSNDARWTVTATGKRDSQVGNGSGTWQTGYREEYNVAGARCGFFGATPVAQQSIAAAATDAATTQTLANSLRSALINLGLCV